MTMKNKLVTGLVVGLFLVGMSGVASAASIIFYTDKNVFNSAVATTLVEDFESVTPKDTSLAAFTHNGISYTGFAGVPFPNVWVASPGYNEFGAGVGTTTTSILTANGDEDFTASFVMPVKAVGFDTYYNGLGPVTVEVYGASGLLDTFNVSPGIPTPNDKEYLGILSIGEPITAFRWTSTLGGQLDTGIDNVAVNFAPIPGAVWLLGSGLVGLVGSRKLRKY
jgi:hypothetical protein